MSNNQTTTLCVSVLSGKGGVGKTNITLNLGCSLVSAGEKVLLMDCDLGLANLDVLLGLAPEKTLQDLLLPYTTPAEVAIPISEGLDFIPAASGMPELVELDTDIRNVLFDKLESFFPAYDFVFLDLGAGISSTVLAMAAMSRLRLVVVTPEPTSLTDSYALMKVLSKKYGVTDFYVVVNQADNHREEVQAFDRLHAACQKFLKIEPQFLGGIRTDRLVSEAVRRQKPLMQYAPHSLAAQNFNALASRLRSIRLTMLPQLASSSVLMPLPKEFS
ncbi:MinD/ParA family protein [Desulfovibrio litoralis]|uniref:Flagellar biosynthesis protein FlhG n=1 Tax=Desulfovibrio litoralis DSM 11393 TaxID=1121455 RepID=A0A1M7S7L2_9BACT|nr:MinD/ParA family protein [Desulfovibrio litoralis]SHN54354.1 flagellar biosynthesis protein FlhG [Desulfovibrio litoralis DSM 11393]